jgi:hypothetical protein
MLAIDSRHRQNQNHQKQQSGPQVRSRVESSSSSSSVKLDCSSSSTSYKSFQIMKQKNSQARSSESVEWILREKRIQWNGWILRSSFVQESTQQQGDHDVA